MSGFLAFTVVHLERQTLGHPHHDSPEVLRQRETVNYYGLVRDYDAEASTFITIIDRHSHQGSPYALAPISRSS